MNNALELAKNASDYIIEQRRNLHKIPELCLQLPQTVKYISGQLDKLGIEYQVFDDISSIVAIIDTGKEGKTLAIRADTDGLPIKEETGLPFCSTNGNMHACGHDGHAAMLLGAAKILNEIKSSLKGKIKLIFQAGEEYPGGAEPLVKKGVLKNPDVDAIIGLHHGIINPTVKKGSLGFKKGPLMASMDRFQVTVQGKGGHGAYPQSTVDSVNIACEIVQSLNKVIAREVPATEPAILSVTRIEGGFNQNILPDIVEIEGTCRATNEDVRQLIARRIKEISTLIAQAYGATVEIEYDFKYPATINDDDFTDFVINSAKKILPESSIQMIKDPIMGGEDMSFYLREVPGTFFFLSDPKLDENPYPHHNSKFDIDENLMHLGTAVFVQTAMDFLK